MHEATQGLAQMIEAKTERVIFAVGVQVPRGTGQELTDELARICTTPAGVAAALDAIARSIWEQVQGGQVVPVTISVHEGASLEVR